MEIRAKIEPTALVEAREQVALAEKALADASSTLHSDEDRLECVLRKVQKWERRLLERRRYCNHSMGRLAKMRAQLGRCRLRLMTEQLKQD